MRTIVTNRLTKVLIATLILLASTMAAAPAQADEHCDQAGAKLLKPTDGQANVQTQLGSQSLDGTPVQGIFFSTTGYIDVEIAHQCLRNLGLIVEEVQADGSLVIIHETIWSELTCERQVFEDSVYIGLDAGEYVFSIGWSDCLRKVGGDRRHNFGADPPLPL